MSSFTNALILEATGDDKLWRVHDGFEYRVGDAESRTTVPVPAGFLTDLESIPRLALSIVPRRNRSAAAAVVHDKLYCTPYLYVDALRSRRITRLRCDEIFYEALRVQKVSRLRAWVLYRAVRIGGRIAWNKHRLREHEQKVKKINGGTMA